MGVRQRPAPPVTPEPSSTPAVLRRPSALRRGQGAGNPEKTFSLLLEMEILKAEVNKDMRNCGTDLEGKSSLTFFHTLLLKFFIIVIRIEENKSFSVLFSF